MFDQVAHDRFLANEGRLFAALEADDREEARLHARKVTRVVALRRLASDAGRGDLVVCEIAATLRVSEQAARRLLATADLFLRHPDTFALLRESRLRVRQADAMVDALSAVTPARACEVERLVLDRGIEDSTPSEIRALVRRVALRLDAREAAHRRTRAVADRSVAIFPGEDGVCTLWASMSAEDLVRVDRQLTEMAKIARRRFATDPRTLDQWRSDLLVASVLGQVSEEVRAKAAPVQAVIEIPVSVATDLADAPVELLGFGPINPEHARLLLPAADLRAAYVDAHTGEHVTSSDDVVHRHGGPIADETIRELHEVLLEMAGRPHLDDDRPEPGYRPSRKLAERVRRRYRFCTFLRCTCSSRDSDLDHVVPWPVGPTNSRNLRPKSRRHHRAKQAGWRCVERRDGSALWISPSGRTYRRPPRHHPPPPPRARPDTAADPQRVPDDEPPF